MKLAFDMEQTKQTFEWESIKSLKSVWTALTFPLQEVIQIIKNW